MNPFQAVVSALCYSVVYERSSPLSAAEFPHNRTVKFVLDQHGRMPEYLRFPFAMVTVLFGWSSVLRYGRPFHKLPHASRWRQVEAWRSAPVGVCRDLIKFYESFVVFYLHSTRPGAVAGPSRMAA